MKILYVCTANVDRSPTAELIGRALFPDLEHRSAGTSESLCEEAESQFLSKKQVKWANHIICMEAKHEEFIKEHYRTGKKVTVLNIPDNYAFKDQELIDMLAAKLVALL